MQTSASLRTDLIVFAASVCSQMCFLGSADNWHAAMFIIMFLIMLLCRFGLLDADQTLVVQCPSLSLYWHFAHVSDRHYLFVMGDPPNLHDAAYVLGGRVGVSETHSCQLET